MMFDRIFRIFSKMGDGLLGLFIKVMIVLIILVIIIAAVQGMISHWAFVLSLLVGMLLSPIFYKELSKKLRLDFPEFFTWGITDVIDILIPTEETYASLREEHRQKREAATRMAADMEAKADTVEKTAQIYIRQRKMYKKEKADPKGFMTARMKKALMMQLDDDENEVIRDLHNPMKEINWDNYL